MDNKEIILTVYGMKCQKCVARVTGLIAEFSQVEDVAVSLDERAATIVPAAGADVPLAMISEKLRAAGFSTEPPVEDQPAPVLPETSASEAGVAMQLRFPIIGMSCASCAANIEKRLAATAGVERVSVNLAGNFAQLDYHPELIDKERIYSVVDNAGYQAVRDKSQLENRGTAKELRLVLIAAAGAVPIMLLMFVPLFGAATMWVIALLATLVQFSAGIGFYRSAWLSLKNRFANMDVLVALGITAAYGYSLLALFGLLGDSATAFFETSAMLILFIRFGKWLEARAKGQASAALKKLLELQADSATLLDGGVERVIPADQVKVGDLLLVRPGDKIPADGVVVEGEAAVDESMITGESLPVEKTLDSKVIGATINRNGRLVIRATAVGEGSVLSNIVRLVEEAQGDKPPIQRLADRISNVFVPLVILLATLTFCGWLLGSDQGFLFAFQMGISVVVIACPCALGLATPTAIMVGSSVGLEHGVLFKKATALEQISKTKVLLLDKTGTLTSGEFKVDRITVVGHFNEGDLLRYAATLESGSAHPLAKGIVAEAEKRQLERLSVSAQQEIGGRGVRGLVGGKEVACGSRDFLIEQGITAAVVDRSPDGDGPGSQIFVAIDGKLQGVIALTDAIRDNVAAVVMRLQHMGILPVMVTGDSRHVAASVARAIGLEHFEAEVLPGQKLDIVKKYQQQGQLVGMVGDGINDAPALAQADIGIAIGSGTDVARETGDLVLISGNLIDIVRSIELGRKTLGKIRQNLFWAFFYNALGIPLAAGLFYPAFGLSLKPEFAGLAMAFSSVSVVTNSLLLRREKRHFLEK